MTERPLLAGRPGQCNARIDVAVIGLAETGAYSAKALRSAGREIEGIGAALDLMKNIEEAVADAQVEVEVGASL